MIRTVFTVTHDEALVGSDFIAEHIFELEGVERVFTEDAGAPNEED